MSNIEKIQVTMHPNALSALGGELVTSDSVAILELVKNAYDAFGLSVKLSFLQDENGEQTIYLEDDGFGMTVDTIKNAWATVATPYKKKHPIVSRIIDDVEYVRIVSGSKGLGRFSAARLGDSMTIITKHKDDDCIEVSFDWEVFNKIDKISDCSMSLTRLAYNVFESNVFHTGTIIKISKLKTGWTADKIMGLKNELARLISPFDGVNNFNLILKSDFIEDEIKIEPHEFIKHPVYKISGKVDEAGTINWEYTFSNEEKDRSTSGKLLWALRNYENYWEEKDFPDFTCGTFSFEIRAWDLDSDSVADVAKHFDIGKREIRSNIALYKGLSVYRDGILVLPKSDASRDWLGLDAKRISQIGRRISTSQIVGIVNISNKNNPEIKDTTDREKLVDTPEYAQFIAVLYNVVDVLQQERLRDKFIKKKKTTLTDIMAPLSSKPLVEQVSQAVKEGKTSGQVLDIVQEFDKTHEKQVAELNSRLVYYAQTASLGSVALVIMHEFLTGMTPIKRYLNKSKKYKESFDDTTREYFSDAEVAHQRICEVANSFAPLYNRDLRKKESVSSLKSCIEKSIRLIQAKKISADINFITDFSDATLPLSEAELQTIFINLFDNACYWIKESEHEKKVINIFEEQTDDSNLLRIVVADSGSGIPEENADSVFVPGITGKPNGIGMGLVIVAELLASCGGQIGLRYPSDEEGATFVLEIPKKK